MIIILMILFPTIVTPIIIGFLAAKILAIPIRGIFAVLSKVFYRS